MVVPESCPMPHLRPFSSNSDPQLRNSPHWTCQDSAKVMVLEAQPGWISCALCSTQPQQPWVAAPKPHLTLPPLFFQLSGKIIKEAEHRRIDAFELQCWRRLLRIPWTARRSNQSIVKEISPEYSLEGLMLKLKLQYFGHLMRRTDSLEKT